MADDDQKWRTRVGRVAEEGREPDWGTGPVFGSLKKGASPTGPVFGDLPAKFGPVFGDPKAPQTGAVFGDTPKREPQTGAVFGDTPKVERYTGSIFGDPLKRERRGEGQPAREGLDKEQQGKEPWRDEPPWRTTREQGKEAWREDPAWRNEPAWRSEAGFRQEPAWRRDPPWRKPEDAVAEKTQGRPPSLRRLKSLRNAQLSEHLTDEEAWALEQAYQGELRKLSGVGPEDQTELRKRYFGDPGLAAQYLGPARTLLAQVKADMAVGGLDQALRRAVIPVDQLIDIGPHRSTGTATPDAGLSTDPPLGGGAKNDWLLNPTGSSSATGGGESVTETFERRLRGTVKLYAMSNHGLDEVWIDARAVALREEKTTEVGGGIEYFPYLWVGVRATGGGDGWFEDFACTDNTESTSPLNPDTPHNIIIIVGKGETFNPTLMLDVWEPLPEGDPIENTVISNRGYYASDSTPPAKYPLRQPSEFTIGTFEYPTDENGDWIQQNLPDDRVSHTENNLYCIGGPFAWDPRNEENPTAERQLWEQVVILDPEDKKKKWISTFQYKTVIETIGAVAVSGAEEWDLPGKVLGGEYLIGVSFLGPNCNTYCDFNIPGPVNISVEVRVGKAPGRQTTKRFNFTIPASRGEPRAHIPYGYDAGDGKLGNPHDINWVPGAIKVNVALGTIGYDPGIVPRGFGGPPLNMDCGGQTPRSSPVEQVISPFPVTYETELETRGVFPNSELWERRRKLLHGISIPQENGGCIPMVNNGNGQGYSYCGEPIPQEWSEWLPNTPPPDWDAVTPGPPAQGSSMSTTAYPTQEAYSVALARPCGMGWADGWAEIIESGHYCLIDE